MFNVFFFLDGECYEVANYPNNDITSISMAEIVDNPIKECQSKCQEEENCVGFSLKSDRKCILKNKMETKIDTPEFICGPKNCQINGNWSDFGLWMPCSKSCGNGTKRRFRFCTNPKPKYGGEDCEGNNFEDSDCFVNCSTGNFFPQIILLYW